jgi:hypothetical protein
MVLKKEKSRSHDSTFPGRVAEGETMHAGRYKLIMQSHAITIIPAYVSKTIALV